jgi:hypothetical protein
MRLQSLLQEIDCDACLVLLGVRQRDCDPIIARGILVLEEIAKLIRLIQQFSQIQIDGFISVLASHGNIDSSRDM